MHTQNFPETGFYSYHANRLEDLRSIVVKICETSPLPPLHNDVFLVQSNGIAQWLKLALAQDPKNGGLGIAAGMDFSLPSAFIWRAYRAILSSQSVPDQSPLDKQTLIWRLYRILSNLPNEQTFAPLRKFLGGEQSDVRLFQLSDSVAFLFDQYQMYRADWLAEWELGNDVIIKQGKAQDLSTDNAWQPLLWRMILADVGKDAANTSRASVHQRFMHMAKQVNEPPEPHLLPKRIIVFGISSLPKQILEALQVVSKFTQVVFCVVNPCQYYWGDIVSQRDMILAQAYFDKNKQRNNQQESLKHVSLDLLHQHANPLLASLGKQGRDYIRLLEEFDGTQLDSSSNIITKKSDVFVPYGSSNSMQDNDTPNLLNTIQNDILALTPIDELLAEKRVLASPLDHSLVFHEVHSEQREVEVLQDQLLAAFNADSDLSPSDILIMTPDINKYAPHINAVFGLYNQADKRFIPYTISDQGLRNQDPMVIAFESLLSLNDSRFTFSEVMSILELPAISQKYGLNQHALDIVKHWTQGANVRWGIDAQHRESLLDVKNLHANTWQAGLRSMLLGYSMGDSQQWANNIAFAEIGGLEASYIGNLIDFIDSLSSLKDNLQSLRTLAQWQVLVRELLDTMFDDTALNSMAIKSEINQHAEKLQHYFALAQASDQVIPITTFKDILLDSLDSGTLNHRFLMGKINFATLMPMRAIPFKRIYLLGMNDGDFPRVNKPVDFDLMANDYRAGDRSLRDDDRYLFLEALLAAREHLYISWIGRSIKDDAHRPSSLLVSHLQDYVNKFWLADTHNNDDAATAVSKISWVHPLQAFSKRYFEADHEGTSQGLFSYAKEWQQAQSASMLSSEAHTLEVSQQVSTQTQAQAQTQTIDFVTPEKPLSLRDLSAFLKEPVQTFFHKALMIYFDAQDTENTDDELFVATGLNRYELELQLIENGIMAANNTDNAKCRIDALLNTFEKSGAIGIASTVERVRAELSENIEALALRYFAATAKLKALKDKRIDFDMQHHFASGESINIVQSFGHFYFANQNDASECNLQRVFICYSKTSSKVKSKVAGTTVPHYRFEKLLSYWIEHLAGHVAGQTFTTKVLAKDSEHVFVFTSIPPDTAKQYFMDILEAWKVAMTRPLHLDSLTGFALIQASENAEANDNVLHNKEVMDACTKAFEYDSGYLMRAFDDANQLYQHDELVSLSNALYGPIVRHVEVMDHE